MNNFTFITPTELFKKVGDFDARHSLKRLRTIANQPDAICDICGVENVWKYGETGMCFSCTTGESDASEDYELIPESE